MYGFIEGKSLVREGEEEMVGSKQCIQYRWWVGRNEGGKEGIKEGRRENKEGEL